MARDKNWTYEEILLALDTYFRVRGSELKTTDEEAQKLSDTLKGLTIHPESDRKLDKFRSPTGVVAQVNGFSKYDPSVPNMSRERRGVLHRRAWDVYKDRREALSEMATTIRRVFS